MSIKDKYTVRSITHQDYAEWLLFKHYAKVIPTNITYSFGLYNQDNILIGICTFGYPASAALIHGKSLFVDYEVLTQELNRLVIEGKDKNLLSFLVSQCINLIQKPCCLISFADSNQGHHGYIYQATNWIYTGMSEPRKLYYDSINKNYIHPRHIYERFPDGLPEHIKIEKETGGKHRYLYFNGTKKQKKKMRKHLKYEILPYPKGDNERYDASYEPTIQGRMDW